MDGFVCNAGDEMCRSSDLGELFSAISAMHGELATVEKDEKADAGKFSYRYLSLPAFRAAVNPLLAKHGLSLTQHGVGTSLLTCLGHSSGQFLMTAFNLSPLIPAEGCDPQTFGSILTYIQRYMGLPALGLSASEDTDAAGAGQGPRRASPSESPSSSQQATSERSGGLGRHTGSCVESAEKKQTQKGKDFWVVKFSDGAEAACFHQNMGPRAEEMAGTGAAVVRDIQASGDRGQYKNLEELDFVVEDSTEVVEAEVDWQNRVRAKEALVSACNSREMSKDRVHKTFSDYAAFLGVDSLVKALPADLEKLHSSILAGDHDEADSQDTPF